MTKDFFSFTMVSGCGFLIDILLTMGLVQIGLTPFVASFVGAGAAVTFVYVVSLSAVFRRNNIDRLGGYLAYVVWQVFAISVASALIAMLAFLMEPLWATALDDPAGPASFFAPDPLAIASGISKILVTPLTLIANFLFMKWLTEHPRLTIGKSQNG